MLSRTINAVTDNDPQGALEVVDELIARGQDLRTFCRDLMALIRDLTVTKVAGENHNLLESSAFDGAQLKGFAEPFTGSDLIRFFNSIAQTESGLKDATNARLALELGLIKLIEMRRLSSIEDILERLKAFENAAIPAPAQERAAAAAAEPEKKTLKSPKPVTAPEKPLEEPPWESRSYDDVPSESVDTHDIAEIDEPTPIFEPREVPVAKLPPLTSEQLEHIEDKWLDPAYELKLALSGDDLLPFSNISDLRTQLLGAETVAATVTSSASGAAAAPARDLSRYMPELSANENETGEMPVLPPEAGPEEMRAFANAHPVVRRAMRIFRAEIVSVEHI